VLRKVNLWLDLPSPIIFAHRGASACAPENTLAAFELAVQQGAPGIELDAKLCADGHVIVIHNQSVDRTTNGSGKVDEMPLAALRELDAGSFFSEKFRGQKIPTLEEVFEAVGKKVLINVELKNLATPFDALVPKVVELVKKHGLGERILFSSFLPPVLAQAARLLPETPRGLLTAPGRLGWLGCTFGFRNRVYQALHPHRTGVSDEMVKRVQAAGKRVVVWTVNAEAEIRRMVGCGVEGIITDDPALALRLLGRAK
jgi:glycerophosphoryl diester phosphodiesterase